MKHKTGNNVKDTAGNQTSVAVLGVTILISLRHDESIQLFMSRVSLELRRKELLLWKLIRKDAFRDKW